MNWNKPITLKQFKTVFVIYMLVGSLLFGSTTMEIESFFKIYNSFKGEQLVPIILSFLVMTIEVLLLISCIINFIFVIFFKKTTINKLDIFQLTMLTIYTFVNPFIRSYLNEILTKML